MPKDRPVQKHFKHKREPEASILLPTGVINFKRVELRNVLPQLGGIPLSLYYKLRIACCGYLIMKGDDELETCHVCHSNQGFVCPACLGARFIVVDYNQGHMAPCLRCCYEYTGEKGKIEVAYDPERELQSAQRWLARRFPYGVPREPTDADLHLMDTYGPVV